MSVPAHISFLSASQHTHDTARGPDPASAAAAEMPACDASWSSASCTKCVGQGTIPASDGFVPCPQCGGAGKIQNRSPW